MNVLEKAAVLGTVFVCSAKAALQNEAVWVMATAVGLHQGLKYNGNIKNGVVAGVAVLGIVAGVTGVMNVVINLDVISEMHNFKED